MEIRIFEENDRAAVIKLWKECELTRPWNNPHKDIDRKLAFQSDLFFIGQLESTIVATAMAGYDGHRGSVYYLAVHPDLQCKGIGKQLMQTVENSLLSLGCPKLNILIRSSNLPVLDFYQRLEYQNDDVVCIGKRLTPDV